MTREEAITDIKQASYLEDGWELTQASAIDIVNELCDDFEGRTCESCKFLSTKNGELICQNTYNSHQIETSVCGITDEYMDVGNDFGCNKWEKKDD